jgi:hypothetical protein
MKKGYNGCFNKVESEHDTPGVDLRCEVIAKFKSIIKLGASYISI